MDRPLQRYMVVDLIKYHRMMVLVYLLCILLLLCTVYNRVELCCDNRNNLEEMALYIRSCHALSALQNYEKVSAVQN